MCIHDLIIKLNLLIYALIKLIMRLLSKIIQINWSLQLDKFFVVCSTKLKQEGGLFSPEVDPYAFQQNDAVGSPEYETSWTSFRNSFLHGELSLQANLIAFFVAEVPLIPMKDTLWIWIPEVCISNFHIVTEMLVVIRVRFFKNVSLLKYSTLTWFGQGNGESQ